MISKQETKQIAAAIVKTAVVTLGARLATNALVYAVDKVEKKIYHKKHPVGFAAPQRPRRNYLPPRHTGYTGARKGFTRPLSKPVGNPPKGSGGSSLRR